MAELNLKRILLDMLPSPAMKAQVRKLGIPNHLEMLDDALWAINAVFMDAQLRALEEPDLEGWANDAGAAIADAEDLLCRILDWQPSSAAVSNCPSHSVVGNQKAFRHALLLELKEMAHRLTYLVTRGSALGLRKEMMESMHPLRKEFSAILTDEVVGREPAIAEIKKSLGELQERFSILAICGDEGMGKTTLARMIYHDSWAHEHFPRRFWVDARNSFSFDPMRIGRDFAESITEKPCGHQHHHLQTLWLLVNKELREERYLLVLNDIKVKAEDRDRWEQLKHVLLRVGGSGSRVLLVASNRDAGSIIRDMGVRSIYTLSGLPKDDWVGLFLKHLLVRPDQDEEKASSTAKLIQFADMMCSISEGNPLQAKLWGSTFRYTKASPWQDDKNAFNTEAFLQNNQYFPLLSFQYLLSNDARLHQYYNSLFPEDYRPDFEDLLQMLTAEGLGFIPHPSEKTLAINHLRRELVRGNLDPLTAGKLQIYMMKRDGEDPIIPPQCRHLSFVVDPDASSFPIALSKDSKLRLRTLILIRDPMKMISGNQKCKIADIPEDKLTDLTDFLKKKTDLTDLRVLDLRDTMIRQLPGTVDKLLNLRYLNLSGTEIEALPDSLCNLRTLQTLKLAHCEKLRKLPEWIHNLRSLQVLKLSYCTKLLNLPNSVTSLANLQQLDLKGCHCLLALPEGLSNIDNMTELNILDCSLLTQMPRGLGQWSNLHKLLGYIAGGDHGSAISELQALKHLKELHLKHLERVSNKEDAEKGKLQEKLELEHLALNWTWWNMDAEAVSKAPLQVLKGLQPNTALRKLEIISYAGRRFPNWMTEVQPYYYTLVEIKLVNARRCKSLPPLGQLPRLKVVEISGMDAVSSVDETFYGTNGTFLSLERLTFSQMPKLEKWEKVARKKELFPRLTELTLIQCPKFRVLDVSLQNVQRLNVWLSHEMLFSLNWHNLKHVVHLEILGCEELKCLDVKIHNIEIFDNNGCYKFVSLPDWTKPCTALSSNSSGSSSP